MRQLLLAVMAVLVTMGCGPLEPAFEEPSAEHSASRDPLAVASNGGMAFVRLDGTFATADATKASGIYGYWRGFKAGFFDYPLIALKGPSIDSSKPGYATFLTYEWTGSDFAVRGKYVDPWGQVSNGFAEKLPTFQGATHAVAIPDGRNVREVFFYDSTRGVAETWTYSTDSASGHFSAMLIPYGRKFSGLSPWKFVVGFPRGVLFFNPGSREVWRGQFDSTYLTMSFSRLQDLPSSAPYTHVAYVDGYGHVFYDRNSGYAERVKWDADTGTVRLSSDVTYVGPGYDRLVGTGNGQVFFFDSTYGRGLTLDVSTKSRVAQSGFTSDWTSITAIQ